MLGRGREIWDFWDGSELTLSCASTATAGRHGSSRFKSIKLLLLPEDDGGSDPGGSFVDQIIKLSNAHNEKPKTK